MNTNKKYKEDIPNIKINEKILMEELMLIYIQYLGKSI